MESRAQRSGAVTETALNPMIAALQKSRSSVSSASGVDADVLEAGSSEDTDSRLSSIDEKLDRILSLLSDEKDIASQETAGKENTNDDGY